MARQFLISADVEYENKFHYFGLRSYEPNLGYLMLLWEIRDTLNCLEDDIKFARITIECEVDDNLPF